MKTIRTIVATLSFVLLSFALVAWFSVRRNAAFLQRTIYQGFDQTFVVALVMGSAFLLIAVILTVAIVSTGSEDEEDEEDMPPLRPTRRPQGEPQRRIAAPREEQPYRRVSKVRSASTERASQEEPERSRPAPKRERAAQTPEGIALRRDETPAKAKTMEAEAPAKAKAAEAEAPAKDKAVEDEPPAKAAEAEAPREEGTVRCVFCGKSISRDSQFCPHCGKKR